MCYKFYLRKGGKCVERRGSDTCDSCVANSDLLAGQDKDERLRKFCCIVYWILELRQNSFLNSNSSRFTLLTNTSFPRGLLDFSSSGPSPAHWVP